MMEAWGNWEEETTHTSPKEGFTRGEKGKGEQESTHEF